MRINREYILWAHEPAAESGNKEAEELCKRADKCKGFVDVGLHEKRLIKELLEIAQCYYDPQVPRDRYDEAVSDSFYKTAKRIVKTIRGEE